MLEVSNFGLKHQLANLSQIFKKIEKTTPFRLYHLSQTEEKKLEFFFHLGLGNGHVCFGPKFDTSSIFHFVAIPLIAQKIKIFQYFRIF